MRASNSTALVLGRITRFFPGSAALLVGAIDAVTAAQPLLLGVGTLGLLWSSMGVFLILGDALNRIWAVPADRPLLVQLRYQPICQPTGRPWFPAIPVRRRQQPEAAAAARWW